MSRHAYVERTTRRVVDEQLFGDRVVRFLYSRARESAPVLFRALTSRRVSWLLGAVQFDLPLAPRLLGSRGFLRSVGVDLCQCVDPPAWFDTPRKIFERRIRYWDCRPMSTDAGHVAAPADARVIVGSLASESHVFLKGKFFDLDELLGAGSPWPDVFRHGDFAVFRLTPDKYHYNHTPVAGRVVDLYEVAGTYHSCHPAAVVEMVTPYSKNKRVVTVFDTDVEGGTGVGRLAMIEVAALMIGEVRQCYSAERYDDPAPIAVGDFLDKGLPKSLYRPGSSTDVLLFEPGRVRFADDLLRNLNRTDVASHFSLAFARPLVETDVPVRSTIATRITNDA